MVQRAVAAVEGGEAQDPADFLDEMSQRFMMQGSRSPFNWALRLRAYSKRIRNSTTSLGFIYWSEDRERLSYKDTAFSMQDLKILVAHQVRAAQRELEEILLPLPGQSRENHVPGLSLPRLKDDLICTDRGWSFLKDKRNAEDLTGRDRWLLDRVTTHDWLKEEFVKIKANNQIVWLPWAAEECIRKADTFLKRLLLLVHVTSGQPARGTELLSLRFQNTVLGHTRSVFMDDGAVSTVTAYHKGYSITGSTKIIHRYVPKEVGELLVYYLWLVRPFVDQLNVLAFKEK